ERKKEIPDPLKTFTLFTPLKPILRRALFTDIGAPSAAALSSLFFAGKQSPLQPPSSSPLPQSRKPTIGAHSVTQTLHCCNETQSLSQPPSVVGAPSVGVTSVTAPSFSSCSPSLCHLLASFVSELIVSPSSAFLLPGF
ncbi:hypothetical protein PIB30_073161, partial [Stylosanthes scabra]|nr:hypothetical protein [Stylosanthes scabra]